MPPTKSGPAFVAYGIGLVADIGETIEAGVSR
jgi:hypothetical protein